mmetsp:Transcript_33232/g.73495  ORF Transcript_33232/g.73495 Transcript_33232/m.73495 type:complete len:95 (+) Transcript_33232:755-1039(+)
MRSCHPPACTATHCACGTHSLKVPRGFHGPAYYANMHAFTRGPCRDSSVLRSTMPEHRSLSSNVFRSAWGVLHDVGSIDDMGIQCAAAEGVFMC